jgi:hypothetical protein
VVLTDYFFSPCIVRWGSESLKKNRTYLIQSASLWCRFYDIQLHVHRVFALRDPPDPELTIPSMIICKSAAKQSIRILESAKDVLLTPLCSHVLTVSPKPSQYAQPNRTLNWPQKPLFDATLFLLLFFWRKKGIDYDSQEYHAINVATEMLQLTSKRQSLFSRVKQLAITYRETRFTGGGLRRTYGAFTILVKL